MDYNNLSKKDLVEILENIKRTLEGQAPQKEIPFSDAPTNQQSDLESLIGTIPFLMQNKQIFEKNQDIADFAKKLNIYIPSPEKKKREDIIGRIIFAIASFDSRKISEVNFAIKALKKSDIKKGKSNFFKDWENVIKQMKL
jgi:hypothetical protein